MYHLMIRQVQLSKNFEVLPNLTCFKVLLMLLEPLSTIFKLPPVSCTQPPFDPTYVHFWIFPVSGGEFPAALLENYPGRFRHR